MPTRSNRFSISLPTSDRHRAMSFYRDVFDLEPIGTPDADGIPEPLQFPLDEGVLLTLIPTGGLAWVLGERHLAPSETHECVFGLVVDSRAEVDQIVRRLRDAGGAVLTEPAFEDWGCTVLCADPDGHAWQITAEVSPAS